MFKWCHQSIGFLDTHLVLKFLIFSSVMMGVMFISVFISWQGVRSFDRIEKYIWVWFAYNYTAYAVIVKFITLYKILNWNQPETVAKSASWLKIPV